ncbi:hypothetical protein PsalN5692_04058 (plasmid) [Piscirickettsia salmonis]|uniref:hypothetical protein n=1 Tax=Piscirickettsia salmonis TaxID=1238 RepID=UPI0012B82BEE|nr:hypothetical protein [Piscirickettsia salmonis]QGP52549.1 hypothetical protein PsalN5692_04058 [Piscirickettsia salmonis]
MLDPDELLAIGAAMVSGVRKSIKYSENIKELYTDLESSPFKHKRQDKRRSLKEDFSFSGDYARKALAEKVGYCDDLSVVAVHLGKLIHIGDFSEPIYISLVSIPGHRFCLIHQSENLHLSREGEKLAGGLKELSEDPDLENAIIVDPWVYKASKLADCDKHFAHARTYRVEDFYNGAVNSNGHSQCIGNASARQHLVVEERRALRDFNLSYQEETQKLAGKHDSFAKGNTLREVKAELKDHLYRRKQLNDLKSFIQRLDSKSSFWYSHFGHSNRKGKSYQALIKCIDVAIEKYMDIPDEYLKDIFIKALDVATMVRGNPRFKTLGSNRVHVTKTVASLLSSDVVRRRWTYSFEDIPGISLDGIRRIQASSGSDREKSLAVVKHIREETGNSSSYDLDKSSPYYKEAGGLVRRSQGECSLNFYDAASSYEKSGFNHEAEPTAIPSC